MSREHGFLLFLLEMVVASFGSRQKPRERHVFSIRKPLFRRRFLFETQWFAHEDAERARFEFLYENHGSVPFFWWSYHGLRKKSSCINHHHVDHARETYGIAPSVFD